MIERTIAFPVGPDELWRTLTDPTEVGWWLGESVDWDFVLGGDVRVLDEDGDERLGRIEEIDEGRRLRFVWWPVDDDASISEVTYVVEPDDDGCLLTVTERPCFVGEVVSSSASAVASADRWGVWDSRLVGVVGVVGVVGAVGSVGVGGFRRASSSALWC